MSDNIIYMSHRLTFFNWKIGEKYFYYVCIFDLHFTMHRFASLIKSWAIFSVLAVF